MTMEEMSDIVGNYYLDAVPRTFLEQYPLGLLFYVVPAVLLAGAAVVRDFIRQAAEGPEQTAGRPLGDWPGGQGTWQQPANM